MKQAVKKVLRKSGMLDVISRATSANRVEILLYHGFCEGSRRNPALPRLMPIDEFEEQLRLITRYGKPLSLENLVKGASAGIAITFDDGYANNYRLALPVLQKYGFPATIFVTTGFVDRAVPLWGDWLEFLISQAPPRNSVLEHHGERFVLNLATEPHPAPLARRLKDQLHHQPIDQIHSFLLRLEEHLSIRYAWDAIPEDLRPLTWDEIRTMRRGGLITFGSHTVSHPVLSRCTEAVQQFELAESRRRMEQELGETCALFAYPYGKHDDYTEATKQLARQNGYKVALSAESGFNTPPECDWYELRRWGGEMNADNLSFVVSGGPQLCMI